MKPVHLVIGGAASIALLIVALPGRAPTLAESALEPAAPPAAAPRAAAEAPAVAGGRRASGASREQLAAQAKRQVELFWRRDPFAPPLRPEAAQPAGPGAPDGSLAPPPSQPVATAAAEPEGRAVPPLLTGISRRGAIAWAIIDHDVVRVGDDLPGGFRVASIEPRGVTLVRGTERLVLTLGGAR